jgi:hypothetical protein
MLLFPDEFKNRVCWSDTCRGKKRLTFLGHEDKPFGRPLFYCGNCKKTYIQTVLGSLYEKERTTYPSKA